MSLNIFVKIRETPGASPDWMVWAAGCEDFRTKLWGSRQMKGLGLRLLPSIENNLVVLPSEYPELLAESDTIEARIKLAAIRNESDDKWWRSWGVFLEAYIVNIRESVACAIEQGADCIEIE